MSGSDSDDPDREGTVSSILKRLSLYPTSEAERVAVVAGTISLVVPGAGQWYIGHPKRGLPFLIAAVVMVVFYLLVGPDGLFVGIFVEPLIRLGAGYDAFHLAFKGNER